MRIFVELCAVAAAAAFFGAAAQAAEATVQPNYTAITTDLDHNGNLVVVGWLYPMGGATAVCGFYFPEEPSEALEARVSKLLANLTFATKGKKLRISAEGFTRYDSEADARAKGTGKCQASKLPWDASYAATKVDIDIRSLTLRD